MIVRSFFFLFMNECDCNKAKKLRPFDSCIFCAHKHAASALALSNFLTESNTLLKFRIISQLNLSKWHLNKDLNNIINLYDKIILNIFNGDEFKNDLTLLVETLWDLRNNKKLNISFNNYNIIVNEEKGLLNGLIHISNALELIKYEYSYEDINLSYAIGQLNLAEWCFQDINNEFAEDSRKLYKNIETNEININKFEYLIIKIFKFIKLNK